MLKGTAKKVTVYVNEDTQEHFNSLYERILTFLMHKGVSGATATRAMAGFGAHRVMHTPKVEALAEHLPIRIEFIETAEKLEELLPTLYDMVTDGLIEVQDTTVVKSARKDQRKSEPDPKPPHQRKAGKAQMMRIYLGEADRWNGEPLYDAIVKHLRMMDISGATVYRGILGYGAKGHTHKERLLHTSRDLPIMIAVVDTEPNITLAAEAIEDMLDDGLIVLSEVDIVRLVHSDATVPAS
jgi:PII-like signaling protein